MKRCGCLLLVVVLLLGVVYAQPDDFSDTNYEELPEYRIGYTLPETPEVPQNTPEPVPDSDPLLEDITVPDALTGMIDPSLLTDFLQDNPEVAASFADMLEEFVLDDLEQSGINLSETEIPDIPFDELNFTGGDVSEFFPEGYEHNEFIDVLDELTETYPEETEAIQEALEEYANEVELPPLEGGADQVDMPDLSETSLDSSISKIDGLLEDLQQEIQENSFQENVLPDLPVEENKNIFDAFDSFEEDIEEDTKEEDSDDESSMDTFLNFVLVIFLLGVLGLAGYLYLEKTKPEILSRTQRPDLLSIIEKVQRERNIEKAIIMAYEHLRKVISEKLELNISKDVTAREFLALIPSNFNKKGITNIVQMYEKAYFGKIVSERDKHAVVLILKSMMQGGKYS